MIKNTRESLLINTLSASSIDAEKTVYVPSPANCKTNSFYKIEKMWVCMYECTRQDRENVR